jgi:curli biogenesis system outer membrane secretion channel CsgG
LYKELIVKTTKIIVLISILMLMISCAADNVAVQKTEPVKLKKQTPRYTSPDKALDYLGRALIQELQAPVNKRKSNLKPMVIALADFVTAEGKVTRLGRYVSDKITPYFTRSARFSVQERALIDKVIQEHKFQASPFVDEESTQEVGKLLGAETIIAGTISELGNAYYINAKAVGVTEGNILTSIDVEIKRSEKLAALYNKDLPQFKKIKSKVFKAQGIGIPSPKHKNPTLARALAVRAAKGDAMRNLVEQIQAVKITSDTTIKDLTTQDDSIRIQVNSTLQGARVVNQRQLPDGSVEVEMEVELTEEFFKTLHLK